MENNLVKTKIEDHIAVVTLDAPPVNAQSKEFMEELIAVFDELNHTKGVRCVVLTGNGKCFSDIIVASTKAVFGLPEIDIGLMGGVRHTMRVFPIGLTRRMVLTGYRVPAEELYRRGLIEACVEPEDLMDTAMEMARNMASKSPTAIKLAKRALNTVETMGLKDGYRFEQNLTVEMTHHADSKEAMAAFLEKRPAVFSDEV